MARAARRATALSPRRRGGSQRLHRRNRQLAREIDDLAHGGREGGPLARVIAIDLHAGTHLRPEGETTVLRANLERAGTDDQVEILVATSEEAAAEWTRPVTLLWIDGDHEYESVKRDFELWEPHLVSDAVVALHDTFVWPGPERAVRDLLIKTGRFTSFVHAETTTAARRCERLSPRAALARRAVSSAVLSYGVRLRAYDANRAASRGSATLSSVADRRRETAPHRDDPAAYNSRPN